MEAAAILAATAVNGGNKLPANAPQATGDFKTVLNQQVKGQNRTAPPEAMVLPETKGLKEMLELLQQFIAAAGDLKGAETAETTEITETTEATATAAPVEAETSDTATAATETPFSVATETSDAGTTQTADAAAGTETALGTGETAAAGMAAARMTAAVEIVAGTAGSGEIAVSENTAGNTPSDISTTVTGATPAGSGITAKTTAGMQNGNKGILFAAPVLMEALAVMQKLVTTQSGSEPASVLSQKISALVDKFVAGGEVTAELRELMKEFGTAPVIKEMKNMLAGLMNSGNDAAELLKDPLTQPEKGRTMNFTVEKAAAKPGITVEAPKEPTGNQIQFNRAAEVPGSPPLSMGQGAVEPANVTVSTQDSGAANRFITLQHTDTAKTPVNGFIRWTEDILGQIGEKARLILGGGQSEMQIQLKPDFLGKVNLQVTLENGQVTARIGVESLQVKELVEANLRQLQQNLDSQGFKVSNLVVDLSANRQFQHFNRPHDYGHNHTVRSRSAGNVEGYGSFPADDGAVPAGWRSMDSTVDYIA